MVDDDYSSSWESGKCVNGGHYLHGRLDVPSKFLFRLVKVKTDTTRRTDCANFSDRFAEWN